MKSVTTAVAASSLSAKLPSFEILATFECADLREA